MPTTYLGTGILNWNSQERVTDRYGTVWLARELDKPAHSVPFDQQEAENYGRLVAEVLESRPSTHVGDLFRDIYPVRPRVGDRIILGEGVIFFGHQDGVEVVGLRPLDDRDADWLDPHQLYRAHKQTVRLCFEEIPLVKDPPTGR